MNIQLSDFLQHYNLQPPRLLLALSGGLDSMVLLELLSEQRHRLPVLHVCHIHHQLQTGADDWARFCQQQCQQRDIPCSVIKVEVDAQGHSLEAAARQARYSALSQQMGEGDVLFTAQHADDQAETLLLQLLRGAGIDGTAAMPALKPFASGHHARPLLPCSREQLHAFAEAKQLEWVEDPSNLDSRYDRNFLRHSVLPLLQGRWPGITQTLTRVAQNHAETQVVLNHYLQARLADCVDEQGRLLWPALNNEAEPRQRLLLRAWIMGQGHRPPSRKVLERLQQEMFNAREDARPVVAWGNSEVRRYRQHLYIAPPSADFETGRVWDWDCDATLNIPGVGRISMQPLPGDGLPQSWRERRWQVRFRQGGETLQAAGEGHHRELKKVLQELGLPPWQRERLPLFYCDGELVFIPGVFQSQRVQPNEPGILPQWREAPLD